MRKIGTIKTIKEEDEDSDMSASEEVNIPEQQSVTNKLQGNDIALE